MKALMSSAPPERSGGASGTIAISRLLGQTSGAALTALCFSLAGVHGSTYALWIGAAFAALASVASVLRMRVPK
jgi:DHA2 family multidrug resistance protein-like MFS transporter